MISVCRLMLFFVICQVHDSVGFSRLVMLHLVSWAVREDIQEKRTANGNHKHPFYLLQLSLSKPNSFTPKSAKHQN